MIHTQKQNTQFQTTPKSETETRSAGQKSLNFLVTLQQVQNLQYAIQRDK